MQRLYSDAEQGSDEWLVDRIPDVTASNAGAVMAKGSGATRRNYMVKMLCESLSGRPTATFKSSYMQDGNDNEPTARLAYELETGNTVVQSGYCRIPEIKVGASTDGLVGDEGLIEIKNVKPAVQVEFIITGKISATYIKQMQLQMYVLKRKWCDFVSQSLGDEDGELPEEYKLKIVRVERDEELIAMILENAATFHQELEEMKLQLKELTKEK
jgi:predicted phage-related endonuclease